jgi:hypothetical protein
MIDPLFDRLSAAEHHCRGRANAEGMRRPMHVDPLIARAFKAADAMTNRVVENFRAAARNGIEAGIAQPRHRISQGQTADFGNIRDLRGRETVQMYPAAEAPFDRRQQVFVPFDLQIRMEAALHQYACAAQIERLLDLVEDGLMRKV